MAELRFRLDLIQRPVIAQAGLSLHGLRVKESFCLRDLWSLHAYRYKGEMRLQGKVFPFRPGYVSLIAPGVPVEWRFPRHAPHYYVHFKAARTPRGTEIPVLQDLGARFDRFSELFEEMIGFHTQDPARAAVRLWDLLHQVHDGRGANRAGPPMHPNLQIALSLIRDHSFETLLVGNLARRMGVSHNHLTLLFQKHFGCGVRAFIRRERLHRACHLLANSSLSVKSIAFETGYPDLHYFNKLVHQSTGYSPRKFRERSASKRGA